MTAGFRWKLVRRPEAWQSHMKDPSLKPYAPLTGAKRISEWVNDGLILLISSVLRLCRVMKVFINALRWILVRAVSQSFYYKQTLYKTDTSIRRTINGHFEIVNGHLWGVECDHKLRFREDKFLYLTLSNTRHLIDSSYLVGGIHIAQVKMKSVIVPFKK